MRSRLPWESLAAFSDEIESGGSSREGRSRLKLESFSDEVFCYVSTFSSPGLQNGLCWQKVSLFESSLGSAWMLRSPRSLDDVTDEVFC